MDTHEADEYFELHLKNELWQSNTQKRRAAALEQARRDVELHLGVDALDDTNIYSYCAVFEQAAYLLEYFDELESPNALKHESITGIGSRSYTPRKPRPPLSPRAISFLERIAPPGNLSRG